MDTNLALWFVATFQVHVGSRGYPNKLYVFELTQELPKFAMFPQVGGMLHPVFPTWQNDSTFLRPGNGQPPSLRCDRDASFDFERTLLICSASVTYGEERRQSKSNTEELATKIKYRRHARLPC